MMNQLFLFFAITWRKWRIHMLYIGKREKPFYLLSTKYIVFHHFLKPYFRKTTMTYIHTCYISPYFITRLNKRSKRNQILRPKCTTKAKTPRK